MIKNYPLPSRFTITISGVIPISKMDVFSLERDELSEKPEAIKWTIGKEKYELYLSTLREMDIASVTQHCLSVMHKIDAVIGADDTHRAVSYSKVLPRTFSVALCATWDVNAVDHPVKKRCCDGFHEAPDHKFLCSACTR